MFNVISAKLTASIGESGWSQVYEHTPPDLVQLNKKGSLYLVVSADNSGSGIDTISEGRSLLSKFHEEYFNLNQSGIYIDLKKTIEKISKEFELTLKNIDITAVVLAEDVLYSVSYGGGGLMICRDGSVATILRSTKGAAISASGYPKDGDTLILATDAVFKMVDAVTMKSVLSSETPQSAVDILTPKIHSGNDQGKSGALILRFQKKPAILPEVVTEVVNSNVIENSAQTKPSKRLNLFLSSLYSKIPKRNIYIKSQLVEESSPQSKKVTFLVALILLALLGVSIGFGIRQKKSNDLKAKYQSMLNQAGSDIDQAISLAGISSEKSRDLFRDAEDKLSQIDLMNIKDSKVDELKQKISDSRAAILGEYLSSPEMFLDLTLLSSGFKGDVIAFSGGQIYVLDKDGNRVIGVNATTKKSKVVAGPSVVNGAQGLACYEDKVYVLESDGIYRVDSGSQKVINKSWQDSAIIAAYAGNMYVLDKSSGLIYRYQGNSNTFGDKQNWTAPGINTNFSNVSQITIDGSIYVLYPNSKVQKFSQGSPQNFNITGLVPEIGKVDAINANPDNQYVYLLDKSGKRVVVTDKKGVYKAQYIDPNISNSTGLIVSEADKKIILLTGDKLYSIDIKHL